ncbi:MAG: SprT-like domain-containing protein [Bacteroidaceae bacterium]|nr:SprT-like domain-containing protein [Bacteroidaceae bacterium]
MVATIPYVEATFARFNDLCFEGRLKPLPVRLSRARSFLGKIEFKRKRQLFGSWKYSDFVLVVSSLLDLPETLIEDIILHEMIHYFILSQQLQDTSTHGVIFKRMMRDINARYNRNVTISHRFTEDENELDNRRRQHLLCVAKLSDGRAGIMLAAHTRVLQLWNDVKQIPSVESCRWFTTTDPFFNRYPRAVRAKVYLVDEYELEQHLNDARPLQKIGRKIYVQSPPVQN